MPAPTNPYRNWPEGRELYQDRDAFGTPYEDLVRSGIEPAPAPQRGPGLTAEDLNEVALRHYSRGFFAAKRLLLPDLRQQGEQLVKAYDEGHDAATDANLHEFAAAVRRRLIADVHFGLMDAARHPPKRTAAERAELVLAALVKVTDWLDDIEHGREPGV